MVGEDADPDLLTEHLPESVVARHDEEVGRIVRAGDDDLVGLGQLGRLGGDAVNGCEAGRDAVAEVLAGVGQGYPGAGAVEQSCRQPCLELGDLAADAREFLEELQRLCVRQLKETDEFTLPSMAEFVVRQRAARTTRNPRTGDPIQLEAREAVTARVARQLKDSFQERRPSSCRPQSVGSPGEIRV